MARVRVGLLYSIVGGRLGTHSAFLSELIVEGSGEGVAQFLRIRYHLV